MKIRGIHYNVQTTGEGDPLVLLHGFTGSIDNWKPYINLFAPYRQIVLIDLIGHGKSDKPKDALRYRMEETVEDLTRIFDELNLDNATLLGYSMGGRTALSFAMIYPERVNQLILESSSPGLKSERERAERRERDQKLASDIEAKGIEWFVEKWEQIPLFQSQQRLSDQARAVQRSQRLKNSTLGLANSLRGMGTGEQPSWWDSLEELDFPVTLITGEEDLKFCSIAKEMKSLLKQASHVEINRAGHAIHMEQPDFFAKIVIDALKKHS